MFWSEIGSGFGKPGGTPLSKIPRSTPPPRDLIIPRIAILCTVGTILIYHVYGINICTVILKDSTDQRDVNTLMYLLLGLQSIAKIFEHLNRLPSLNTRSYFKHFLFIYNGYFTAYSI